MESINQQQAERNHQDLSGAEAVAKVKTWFTGRGDDPRITVIQVAPTDGYYSDTKHGQPIAGMKMLIGAAIGKTLDDSIEGALRFRHVSCFACQRG